MKLSGVGAKFRDQKGAVLIFVSLSMVALLSSIAVAVDVGMLMTARAESQRTADAAALAGAGVLAYLPNDSAQARSSAQAWTALNDVRGIPVSTLGSDIQVDLTAKTVEVWVHNTVQRGNAIPTTFARIFGWDRVDIVTAATAEASAAGSAKCLLPIALPDRWIDDGDGQWDPPADLYTPWPNPGHTGYGENDIGLQVQIKTQPSSGGGPGACQTATSFDPCNSHPGWHCWWLDNHPSGGGGGGVSALGPRIFPGCDGTITSSSVSDDIWAASGAGNTQSLIHDEFKDLVDSDPGVSWDDQRKCVTRGGQCTFDSPRIRALPIVRPDQVTGGGANVHVPIHAFTGVFVEKVSCSPTVPHGGGPQGRWNVYVRLMGHTGFDPGTPVGANGPLSKAIRLIK